MRLIRPLLAAAAALALSGCISLLPKTDPAQLYRFGAVPQAAGAASSSGQIGILKPRSGFTQAAAGDRILTVTNGQAAYIAAARWVAPASVLFEEAVANAYDSNPGAARLVTRGEVARADLVMRLDVRSFETVYDQGPEAAPQVVVRVRVAVTRARDRALVGDKLLEATVRAGDNRVGAIVPAYDQAVGQVVSELVTWTNGLAAGG